MDAFQTMFERKIFLENSFNDESSPYVGCCDSDVKIQFNTSNQSKNKQSSI